MSFNEDIKNNIAIMKNILNLKYLYNNILFTLESYNIDPLDRISSLEFNIKKLQNYNISDEIKRPYIQDILNNLKDKDLCLIFY
jgi:hypothetical protein